MSFINFLRSRHFWISVLLAILLLFATVKITLSSLKGFTNHGESIMVPDLHNLSITQVEDTLKALKLKYAVNDSDYLPGKKANIVLYHDPEPNSKVKEGRTIYLSISSRIPPPVKMPDLVSDNIDSLRAVKLLAQAGLRVGKISYFPREDKNHVKDQQYMGQTIPPGKEIPKGSRIDLVLTDGLGPQTGEVPNLVGLTLGNAKWTLITWKFNIGFVQADETVTNKDSAYIYKQVPESPAELNYGQSIDVFVTKELPTYLKNTASPSQNP